MKSEQERKEYAKNYYKTHRLEQSAYAKKSHEKKRQAYYERNGVEMGEKPNYNYESYCRTCQKTRPKGVRCPGCNQRMANIIRRKTKSQKLKHEKEVVRY